MSATGYRRLPGTRRGVIARASAWAASDHILLVQGSRVNETYKRVYFRDVQALLITKRNRFVIQTPWFLIFPGVGAAMYWMPANWQATGIAAGVLLLGLLAYLYIASVFYSCRLYIATAVGNVQVGSVFRVWQARRFQERVYPMLMAAQQDLIPVSTPVETLPEIPQ